MRARPRAQRIGGMTHTYAAPPPVVEREAAPQHAPTAPVVALAGAIGNRSLTATAGAPSLARSAAAAPPRFRCIAPPTAPVLARRENEDLDEVLATFDLESMIADRNEVVTSVNKEILPKQTEVSGIITVLKDFASGRAKNDVGTVQSAEGDLKDAMKGANNSLREKMQEYLKTQEKIKTEGSKLKLDTFQKKVDSAAAELEAVANEAVIKTAKKDQSEAEDAVKAKEKDIEEAKKWAAAGFDAAKAAVGAIGGDPKAGAEGIAGLAKFGLDQAIGWVGENLPKMKELKAKVESAKSKVSQLEDKGQALKYKAAADALAAASGDMKIEVERLSDLVAEAERAEGTIKEELRANGFEDVAEAIDSRATARKKGAQAKLVLGAARHAADRDRAPGAGSQEAVGDVPRHHQLEEPHPLRRQAGEVRGSAQPREAGDQGDGLGDHGGAGGVQAGQGAEGLRRRGGLQQALPDDAQAAPRHGRDVTPVG